jgi:hypothetical protein
MTVVEASSSTGSMHESRTLASQHAKWPRPPLTTGEVQHDSITPPPLQEAAAPVAFPITGISGAVPCWTTVAMIVGVASRAVVPP